MRQWRSEDMRWGCAMKRFACREPSWFRECQARACSILVIVSFTLAVVSLAVITDTTLLSLSASLTPARCTVTMVRKLRGLSNCSWTSCRQSCTAEYFACEKIYVSFELRNTASNGSLELNNATDLQKNSLSPSDVGHPFFVNIPGCGYEPEVSCGGFYRRFAQLGKSFPCQVYFDDNKPIVVPDPTFTKINNMREIIENLVISFSPLLVCVMCISYAYARSLFAAKPKMLPFRKKGKKKTFYENKLHDINTKRKKMTAKVCPEPMFRREVGQNIAETHLNGVSVISLENIRPQNVLPVEREQFL